MADHLDRLLEEDDERRNPELDEAIEETKRKIKEAFRVIGRRKPSQARVPEQSPERPTEPEKAETEKTDAQSD